ncbi:Lp29 family lipoprotein [Leptospira terpstrae]|uniref:Lipoprotein n=1 Tax=Leptospira terpstrae serovar Hualin str. LT 11-33 = ATCC 700639 TaxID=1257025 RepID=N1VT88_9LEPT|nr:hypothetical protein [Leptospira terpstrae]EMY62939.1 hypothetical protein LEP1GSC203_3369 [Leptospira terpstrae serovar Hualin str. LT 11-33 = ATCC 700639]
MKKLLLILFTLIGCSSYESYTIPDSKFTKITPEKRIALIGFLPYDYQLRKNRHGDEVRASATVDYEKSMKPLFLDGKDIELYTSKSGNSQITRDNCIDFVYAYINVVKDSGKDELRKFIDFELTPDISKTKCIVKSENVDFYILGIPGKPLNPWRDYDESFLGFFKSALSVLTFFIYPTKKVEPVNATFNVYDSKLNLIDKFDYKKQVIITTSWWFNLNLNNNKVSKDIAHSITQSQENITKEFSYDFNEKYRKK